MNEMLSFSLNVSQVFHQTRPDDSVIWIIFTIKKPL